MSIFNDENEYSQDLTCTAESKLYHISKHRKKHLLQFTHDFETKSQHTTFRPFSLQKANISFRHQLYINPDTIAADRYPIHVETMGFAVWICSLQFNRMSRPPNIMSIVTSQTVIIKLRDIYIMT